MAYKKKANPRCQWQNGTCKRRPTHVVYTAADKPVGAYCKKHATLAVKDISAYEQKLKREADEARANWPVNK